jgi:hypothetical protein
MISSFIGTDSIMQDRRTRQKRAAAGPAQDSGGLLM